MAHSIGVRGISPIGLDGIHAPLAHVTPDLWTARSTGQKESGKGGAAGVDEARGPRFGSSPPGHNFAVRRSPSPLVQRSLPDLNAPNRVLPPPVVRDVFPLESSAEPKETAQPARSEQPIGELYPRARSTTPSRPPGFKHQAQSAGTAAARLSTPPRVPRVHKGASADRSSHSRVGPETERYSSGRGIRAAYTPTPDPEQGDRRGPMVQRQLEDLYATYTHSSARERSETRHLNSKEYVRFHFPQQAAEDTARRGEDGSVLPFVPFLNFDYYDVEVPFSLDDPRLDDSPLSLNVPYYRLYYSRRKKEEPLTVDSLKDRYGAPSSWDDFSAIKAKDIYKVAEWCHNLRPRGIGDFKPMFILCQQLVKDILGHDVDLVNELAAEHARELEEKDKRIRDLEAELAALLARLAALQEMYDKLHREHQELGAKYAAALQRERELKDRMKELLEDLQAKQALLDDTSKDDELARLRAMLAALQEKFDALSKEYADALRSIDDLRRREAELNEQMLALLKEMKELKAKGAAGTLDQDTLDRLAREKEGELVRGLRDQELELAHAAAKRTDADREAQLAAEARLAAELAAASANAVKSAISEVDGQKNPWGKRTDVATVASQVRTAQMVAKLAHQAGARAFDAARRMGLGERGAADAADLAAAKATAGAEKIGYVNQESNVIYKYKYKILTIGPGNNKDLEAKLRALQAELDSARAEIAQLKPVPAPHELDPSKGGRNTDLWQEPEWLERLYGDNGQINHVKDFDEYKGLWNKSVEYLSSDFNMEVMSTMVGYSEEEDDDDDGIDDPDTYDDNIFTVMDKSGFLCCDVPVGEMLPRHLGIAASHYEAANSRKMVETNHGLKKGRTVEVRPITNPKDKTPTGNPVVFGTMDAFFDEPALLAEAHKLGMDPNDLKMRKQQVFDKVTAGLSKGVAIAMQAEEDMIRQLQANSHGIAKQAQVTEEEAKLSAHMMTRVSQFALRSKKKLKGPTAASQLEQLQAKQEGLMQIMNGLLKDKRKLEDLLSKPTMQNAIKEIKRYREPKRAIAVVVTCFLFVLNIMGAAENLPVDEMEAIWYLPQNSNQLKSIWANLTKKLNIKVCISTMKAMNVASFSSPDVLVAAGPEEGQEKCRRFEAVRRMMIDCDFDECCYASKVAGALHQWITTMLGVGNTARELDVIDKKIAAEQSVLESKFKE